MSEGGFSLQEVEDIWLIWARHFEGSQELSWPRNATFCILAKAKKVSRHNKPFSKMRKVALRGQESVLPKLNLCQNAESGISGPRKFLATFKVSRPNKPLETEPKHRHCKDYSCLDY